MRIRSLVAFASLALSAPACSPEPTTGYTLNIFGNFDGAMAANPEDVPNQLLISCFVGNKIVLEDKVYPTNGPLLEYNRGRIAQVGIDTAPTNMGERRIWVRAVRIGNSRVLAEAAKKVDEPAMGSRKEVPLTLAPALEDTDGDGVPQVIDNCPFPNPSQATCTSDNPDAAAGAGSGSDPVRQMDASPLETQVEAGVATDASVF